MILTLPVRPEDPDHGPHWLATSCKPSSSSADVLANPAITSIAILTALALVLSPYVLVIGGVFLLFSAASLPGPLKRILPGPVVEVGLTHSIGRHFHQHQQLSSAAFICIAHTRTLDTACLAAVLSECRYEQGRLACLAFALQLSQISGQFHAVACHARLRDTHSHLHDYIALNTQGGKCFYFVMSCTRVLMLCYMTFHMHLETCLTDCGTIGMQSNVVLHEQGHSSAGSFAPYASQPCNALSELADGHLLNNAMALSG